MSSKPRAKRANGSPWRNRIVESGVQAADQFIGHPDNWRVHPHEQEQALAHVMDRVGWVQEVLVSKRSGYLLDGHLRVKAALAKGDETPVPYKVVDVTQNEEALLLAAYDPVGALAGTDRAKLDELVDLLPEEDAAFAKVLHGERKALKKLVAFDVHGTFTVLVDCQNATQQAALLAHLRAEGYTCRTE